MSLTIAAVWLIAVGAGFGRALAQTPPRKLNAGELADQLQRGPISAYWRTPAASVSDQPAPQLWFVECEPLAKFTPEGAAAIEALRQVMGAVPLEFGDVRAAPTCQALMAGSALNAPKLAPARALTPAKASSEVVSQALHAELTGSPLNRLVIGASLDSATSLHPEIAKLAPGEVVFFRVTPIKTLDFLARSNTAELVSAANQAIVKRQATEAAKVAAATPQAANSPSPSGALATASAGQPGAVSQGLPAAIDPKTELRGLALVQALRKGGYVLYMRHASATVGSDAADMAKRANWWDDCTLQRNLSDQGRTQAKLVGSALRELKIPLGKVQVSQFCRNKGTAMHMGLGQVEVNAELNHAVGALAGHNVDKARFALLAKKPSKGNTLLISHLGSPMDPRENVVQSLGEAEIIVFDPHAKNAPVVVGRIPLDAWDGLKTLDWASRNVKAAR
jgi:phosphohistidine phosphatase SixA